VNWTINWKAFFSYKFLKITKVGNRQDVDSCTRYTQGKKTWGTFDSAEKHKRQRRKRQSETAKREKSQTSKFV